jgi:hypothetical protein
VVSVSGSGCCSRAWQTVRGVLADFPRGVVCPGVLHVRRMFLSTLVSIRMASCFCPEGVWRTIRPDVADCPCGTSCSRTVQGRGTDRLRVEVLVGSFCSCLTHSPPWVADRPHGDSGPFATGPQTVRQGSCSTAMSFASCFVLPLWYRLGFVPRVGRSVVTT